MLVRKFNISKIITFIVVCIFVIISINFLCTKSETIFKLVGYRSYIVLSGSMKPEFNPGDMVVVKHKDKTDIEVNDVVTFRDYDGNIITHRIIEKLSGNEYITKGDNNNVTDEEVVNEENIIGEVKFNIPKIGYILSLLANPKIIPIEIILLAIFILIYYKD
ncbi:MAG: signal peptidase I [Clostridium sp.]|uniref:signal peptidase I n=1 Tax=Clostridium sp. TaxID=1506 RepID=UPI003F29FA16